MSPRPLFFTVRPLPRPRGQLQKPAAEPAPRLPAWVLKAYPQRDKVALRARVAGRHLDSP
jgi:hypothetical protein